MRSIVFGCRPDGAVPGLDPLIVVSFCETNLIKANRDCQSASSFSIHPSPSLPAHLTCGQQLVPT